MKCPLCGNGVIVDAILSVHYYPDGTFNIVDGWKIDDEAYANCDTCKWEGKVEDTREPDSH